MQRTDREAAWLEELGATVQDKLRRAHVLRILRLGDEASKETDDEVDGWYYEIASFKQRKASFYVFIDNSLGSNRRAVFYGVGTDSRKEVDAVNEACVRRWPRPQVFVDPESEALSRLRYTDPFVDTFKDEYYYGWYERESPDINETPSADLVARIVERLLAILLELEPKAATIDPLQDLAELDSLGTRKVRL